MFREQSSYVDIDDSLVRYASELCIKRPPHGAAVRRMETTGAQFDPSGRFLVADVSLFHPVLYAVGSPEPLATMSSLERYPHMNPCLSHSPHSMLDKYAGYRNSCTVKRGSFGFESQTGHLYYVTGSTTFGRMAGAFPPPRRCLRSARRFPPPTGSRTRPKARTKCGSAPKRAATCRRWSSRPTSVRPPLPSKARARL